MATARNSVEYTKLYVNKYLGGPADMGGRVYPLTCTYVTVTEVVTDTVNLVVLPANWTLVGMDLYHDAATSTAVIIGDSGSANRYMASVTWAAAGTVSALAGTGQNYKPTADTVIFLTWVTTNPGVGVNIKGVFWAIPGA